MGEEHDDLWFVQLRSGETRAWSLDELDNAFQSNVIDEGTLVRKDGTTAWAPLAQVLAESDGTEQTPAYAYAEAPNSLSAQTVAQPFPSAPPPPVVSELYDLDPDAMPFKRSRKGMIAGGFIAAAVIAVVAVTGTRIVAQRQAIANIELATKAAAAANALAAKTPATPAVTANTDSPPPTDTAPRLSDEQKKKVLDADKKREAEKAKRDAEAAKKAARNAPHKAAKGADPIRKGGSKYDPLNGAI